MGSGGSTIAADTNVVVVGAGPGGAAIARILDSKANVTCFEKRGGHVWKVGMIRGVLEPEFASQCIFPLENCLKRGKTITGVRVTGVTADSVTCSDGSTVKFDFLVLAVGARCFGPFEPVGIDESSVANMKAFFSGITSTIERASNILICGGGPVGVELAGEIRDHHPSKTITIVHNGPTLCDRQGGTVTPVAFQKKLMDACAAKNITVKCGVRADLSSLGSMDSTAVFEGQKDIPLSDGSTISCDLVVPCIGSAPEGSHLQGVAVDEKGYIKVNEFLQVDGFAAGNVFAIGDCNNSGDIKMAAIAGSKIGAGMGTPAGHADLVLENIGLHLNKKPLKKLKLMADSFMVVPVGAVGKVGAVAGLPGPMHGAVLGMKGKDYFVKAASKPFPATV